MKLCQLLAITSVILFVSSFALIALSQDNSAADLPAEVETTTSVHQTAPEIAASSSRSTQLSRLSRSTVLVGSLTVFALAVFVGFEVIAKVPPTLHTPLMSGSNAISGITVVGSIIAAGNSGGGIACLFAMIAIALATVNVVGGFVVTYRMLLMFKKR